MYNVIYPKKKSLEDKNKTLSFLNSITEKANVVAEKNGKNSNYNVASNKCQVLPIKLK